MSKLILKECKCGLIYDKKEESRIVGKCKYCVSKLDKKRKQKKQVKAVEENLEKLASLYEG